MMAAVKQHTTTSTSSIEIHPSLHLGWPHDQVLLLCDLLRLRLLLMQRQGRSPRLLSSWRYWSNPGVSRRHTTAVKQHTSCTTSSVEVQPILHLGCLHDLMLPQCDLLLRHLQTGVRHSHSHSMAPSNNAATTANLAHSSTL